MTYVKQKNNGVIYVHNNWRKTFMNTGKTTIIELHAPDCGQAHTECSGVKNGSGH